LIVFAILFFDICVLRSSSGFTISVVHNGGMNWKEGHWQGYTTALCRETNRENETNLR
jgi:hypothetical protein